MNERKRLNQTHADYFDPETPIKIPRNHFIPRSLFSISFAFIIFHLFMLFSPKKENFNFLKTIYVSCGKILNRNKCLTEISREN